LEAAATVIWKEIVGAAVDAGMFSVIVDEARDNSCPQQMLICIRYVDSVTHSVAERFLGFVPLQQLSAEVLSSTIIQFLVDVGLSVNCCVAQSYDEAAVMAGVTNEVQKVIRDAAANPCPYVHCHSHRLNLVLVDVSKQLDFVGNTCTWFTLISGHPSAADRAQNSESMPAEDQSSITEPCNQDSDKPMLYLVCIISCCYD